jgi:hypothetical protein
VDGFPVPKRVTRGRLTKAADSEISNTDVYEFLDLRFADLPDEELTLAAFGLPEAAAGSPIATRTRGLGYLFLCLSLAALVAALVFKIASSRIKRASGA